MEQENWDFLFYTKDVFHRLYEASDAFNDDLNKNHRVRQEDKSFASFIDAGSDALISEHPDIVEKLL